MAAEKRWKFVEMRAGFSGIPMPRIKGSRIRVSILAGHYMDVTAEGMTHEQAVADLALNYPSLSVDEIRGGLKYWEAHKAEIEAEIARDLQMEEEALAQDTHPMQPTRRL
jgi:uncharacterized protein (DUF433 family)